MSLFQTIPLPAPPRSQSIFDAYQQAAMIPKELKAADLKNALSQINVNYLPQNYDAENNLKNAQASHYPFLNALTQAQTAAVPSEIALRNAQASHIPFLNALTQAQTNYENLLPGFKNRELNIDQQKANQVGSRFGTTFQLRSLLSQMSPPARAAFIANNPGAYNQLVADLGNKASSELITSQQPPPNSNSLAVNPNAPQVPNQNALGAPAPQMNQINQPQAQQQIPFTTTQQSTDDIQKASQMYTNKELTTNKTRMRAEGGRALENMMQSPLVDQAFNTLAQYSGVIGKGKEQIKRLTNPAEYAKIQSAQEQIEKVLAGSIGTLEGYPTSDFGAQQGLNFFRMAKKFIANDPQAAMQYFNQGRKILSTEARAVQGAANPIFNVNNLPDEGGANASGGAPQYNPQQLNQFAEMAIKQGASRDQVMAKLKQMQGGG